MAEADAPGTTGAGAEIAGRPVEGDDGPGGLETGRVPDVVIATILPRRGPSRPQTHVEHYARHLRATGHRVAVVTPFSRFLVLVGRDIALAGVRNH